MKTQLANALNIPETAILEFKHYVTHYNVILTDGRKLQVPASQLTPEPEPDTPTPPAAHPTPLVKPPPLPAWLQLTDKLTKIVGLGRTSQDRLTEANITTFKQLLDTPAATIAKIVKKNYSVVERWQEDAAKYT